MFRYDRSSKRQSKQRRDLINAEMNVLRDLLPYPVATRHRLSQLQLMACLCVYMRKCTIFAQRDKMWLKEPRSILDNVDVSDAFNSSLLLCTQSGRLLYIGEKAQDVFGLKFVSTVNEKPTRKNLTNIKRKPTAINYVIIFLQC